jgi:hypothetical protein
MRRFAVQNHYKQSLIIIINIESFFRGPSPDVGQCCISAIADQPTACKNTTKFWRPRRVPKLRPQPVFQEFSSSSDWESGASHTRLAVMGLPVDRPEADCHGSRVGRACHESLVVKRAMTCAVAPRYCFASSRERHLEPSGCPMTRISYMTRISESQYHHVTDAGPSPSQWGRLGF